MSDSLVARMPNVRVDHFPAAACATTLLTSNSASAAEHPSYP